jgi:hypothetical protein
MAEPEDHSTTALPAPQPDEDQSSITQKRNDLAALLPICGILFFATPLISTITNDNPSGIIQHLGIAHLSSLCSCALFAWRRDKRR